MQRTRRLIFFGFGELEDLAQDETAGSSLVFWVGWLGKADLKRVSGEEDFSRFSSSGSIFLHEPGL